MSSVEWGTVGEWVSGLGAFAGVAVALGFALREHELRDAAAREAARQAEYLERVEALRLAQIAGMRLLRMSTERQQNKIVLPLTDDTVGNVVHAFSRLALFSEQDTTMLAMLLLDAHESVDTCDEALSMLNAMQNRIADTWAVHPPTTP